MRILLDTCVVIDALQNRAPFSEHAQKLFLYAANERLTGCITAKSLTDIYYLMHHYTHDDAKAREVLLKLLSLFELLDTAAEDCVAALSGETSDFEDAVMMQTAVRMKLDGITTRNGRHFSGCPLPVYLPEELLEHITENDG